MEPDSVVLHNAQRIRYEVFSKFATDLNKCEDFEAISKLLTSQIKFIFDCFIFRVYYRNQLSQLVFQGFQGKSTFLQNGDGIVYSFEEELIENGLPYNLTIDSEGFKSMLAETIFAHQQVISLSALPIRYPFDHEILITIASREIKHFVELDFKFLKLVGEILSNKLSQLMLMNDIARKNRELEVRNKQISSMNRYLHGMISQQSMELVEANHELSTLFYRTSHDFRAPLANIMGLVNLAGLITDDEEVLQLFEQCRRVVNGMDSMLAKLNYLTSPDQADEVTDIDLEQLLKQVCKKFTDGLAACGGSVLIKADGLKPCRSRAGLLSTVFEHIIENSIIFRRGEPSIIIEASETNELVIITIRDNGQGINPAVLPKIFDMYYRGNVGSTGNGLGLYIVKKLLKVLNGDIRVESEEGSYTLFTISLVN